MRTILVTILLSALMMGGTPLKAQNNEKATYFINGDKVENFNGSQLEEQTIIKYIIKENRHYITTVGIKKIMSENVIGITSGPNGTISANYIMTNDETPYIIGLSSDKVTDTELPILDENGTVYILDGNIAMPSFVRADKEGRFITIKEVKDKNDLIYQNYITKIKKYTKKEPKSIKLLARPVNTSEIVYVVDGAITSALDFTKVSPVQLKSIKVIKSPENPLFKQYAKEGTYMVVIAETK